MQRDRTTGATKGYGFASYTEAQSAQLAISHLDGLIIDGKKLAVRLKSNPAEQAAQQHMQHQQQHSHSFAGLRYSPLQQAIGGGQGQVPAGLASPQGGGQPQRRPSGSMGFSPLFPSSSDNSQGGHNSLSVSLGALNLSGAPAGNVASPVLPSTNFFGANSGQGTHATPGFDAAVMQQAMYLSHMQQHAAGAPQTGFQSAPMPMQAQAQPGHSSMQGRDYSGARLFDAYAALQHPPPTGSF